ncbi:MAG: diacylglycerol kinase family protein [Planctomycetaceae bacterium]|nr:diacylglycerol kinase family protein [Planctomycetaceae bacterium]
MRRKRLRLCRIKRRTNRSVPIPFCRNKRTWANKFKDAFYGLMSSFKGQSSYGVHFVSAVLVILFGFFFGDFDVVRWVLIIFCIVLVLAAEMLNTSIENLAKAVTTMYDPKIRLALDISSGAVLFVSFGAALIGIILFAESIIKRL